MCDLTALTTDIKGMTRLTLKLVTSSYNYYYCVQVGVVVVCHLLHTQCLLGVCRSICTKVHATKGHDTRTESTLIEEIIIKLHLNYCGNYVFNILWVLLHHSTTSCYWTWTEKKIRKILNTLQSSFHAFTARTGVFFLVSSLTHILESKFKSFFWKKHSITGPDYACYFWQKNAGHSGL